jgi:hypothetical protein
MIVLMAFGILAVKGVALFVMAYLGARLAIRHERGATR